MQSRAWIAWMAWLLAAGIVRVLPAVETFGPAERFTVTHLTTRDGLAQDSVHGLAMDRAGYLWIGTLQGISRYDGQGFVTHTPRTTPGMPSGGVASMAATEDGTLWIGTTKGLARLIPDGSRVEIEPAVQGYCQRMVSLGDEIVAGGHWGLVHGKPGGATNVPVPFRVEALAATGGSNLWIATPQGLWRMRLPWPATPPRPQLVLAGAFGASMATRGHELWVREGKDLCQLDARTGAMVRRWADVDAEPVLADSHGNLWLAALNPESHRYTELSVLDAGTGRLVPCPIGTGIPTAITSACMEDPSGTLWLGTFTGGLARLRPKLVEVFDTRHGLPDESVQSVQWGPEAGLWVLTAAGTARRVGERFEAMMAAKGMWGNSILGLSEDSALITPAGRALNRVERGKPPASVGPDDERGVFVQRDRAGRMVVGGWSRVRRETGPGSWTTESIPEGVGRLVNWQDGPGGEVFLGTLEGGILHRVGAGPWAQVPLPGQPKAAAALWWEDQRRPWAGSTMGLYRRRDDGSWDHWTEQHGLDEDLVMAIEPDDRGHLWLLGHRGLHRVSIGGLLAVAQGREPKVRTLTLDARDGLSSHEGNSGTPASARDSEGNLWFATTRGLARVRPSAIPPPARPRPMVTQVLEVGNDALPRPVSPALHPPVVFEDGAGRNLRFKFTAPLPSAGDRVRLKYRLAGANAAWINADASREATFVGLKPGLHHFEVLAAADDGPWSPEPARWSFQVRPLWWERMDLQAGCAAVILAVACLLVWRRLRLQAELANLRQARAIEDERRRLARDMHDGLGAELARVNLAASTSPVDAGMVSRDLLHRLQTLVWLTDPAEDRLDTLLRCLASRVERFFPNDPPAVHVEIPSGTPPQPIDGRIRRELVAWLDEGLANIARHAGARNVRLQAHVAHGALCLVLSDDGRGFVPSSPAPGPGGGHGLVNLNARIHALGGQLEIQAAPGHGTQLRAVVPLPAGTWNGGQA